MAPQLKAPWSERIILTVSGAAAGAVLTALLLPRNHPDPGPPPRQLPPFATASAGPAATRPAQARPDAEVKAEARVPMDEARLKELERLDKEAKDRLIEAQSQLAEGRKRIFEKNFALRQAFETWKVNNSKEGSLHSRNMDASGWWGIQKDPKTLEAMGKAARMLMVKEMAATLQDPDTKGWVDAWAVHPAQNSPGYISHREKFWNDPSTRFPNFAELPPPKVTESILNPATLSKTFQDFQLTAEEQKLIDPGVFAYLEEAAQVGMLSVCGERYYDLHKGAELEALEKRAAEMNLAAIRTTKDLKEYTEKQNSGARQAP